MKCESCGRDEAVVHLIRLEGGVVSDARLCHECVRGLSKYRQKISSKSLSVASLLTQLAKGAQEAAARVSKETAVSPCPSCGLEFASYKATMMLGCPDCYDSFSDQLLPELRRIHGSTQHVGTSPEHKPDVVERQKRLADLKEELTQAVENEDFERAAFLRDEIKKHSAG